MKTLLSSFALLSSLFGNDGESPLPSQFFSFQTAVSSVGAEEIQDLSSLPFLNPDLAERKTAKLRLPNGLEALLISDPSADQSAACLAVKTGSWDDPSEYPGMAHFCEHMLFMGTEKYPSENEFFSLVSDYGGMTNAFTAPNRTVYMFSSETEGFVNLLDRFAHFFIDPLFNPSGIAREMHAVDQEFAKNLENDSWREYMVFKETGNPNHPNKLFSTGNSQTLSKIPQNALKNWHQYHYGANRMHLAIYSSLPLDVLKETTLQIFSAVPQTSAPLPDHTQPLSSQEQRGKITYIKPIQNKRLLTLYWELPEELTQDETKSAELLAYTMQRGQRFSLYEKLNQEHFIDGMSVRVNEMGGKDHQFFQIALELTQKGIDEVDTVIQRCFETIAGIRAAGIPTYLFKEQNAITQLHYQYQGRKDAFSYAMKLGDSLPDETLDTFPRKSLLASDYSAEKVEATLFLLTPETCSISLLASPNLTKVPPDRKEKWFGTEYAVRPVPASWLARWSAAAPNPEIRLPEPNPFLPSHLERAADPGLGSTPLTIADNESGIAYYIRSPEFAAPESVYSIHILSPEINPSARSTVLASLYLDHLTDVLHPTLAAAASANLNCRFSIDRSRINVTLFGFSEKAPVLLQEVAKQMPLNPPTLEQFSLYYARHEKEYLNGQKELAARQAKEVLDSVVNQDKTTSKEKLAALNQIHYEDFLNFHKKLFEKTYIQALFSGNLELKEAESAWLDIMHVLGRAPYPKEEHPQTKVLRLPESGGPFCIVQSADIQGNAAILLLDQGLLTMEKRAAQEILSSALKEAFFNELRTKQKTGYIAQSDATEVEGELFQYFLVQSNTHQPDDLLFRFEFFIETFNDALAENISSDRFDTLKASLVSSLKNRYRSLKDKSALWDLLAFQRDADFSFIEKRIGGLESLSYDQFLVFSNDFLSRKNHKRIAVLMEGKLNHPFAYRQIGVPQIADIAHYSSRPEKKIALAEPAQN